MIRILTLLLCTVQALAGLAQSMPLSTVASMPPELEESSGLVKGQQPGTWWSHNDSGGEPVLHCIDENGNVLRSLVVRGVANVDWEEITADQAGHVYIGDFGNNGNSRQDLVVYRIPHPDLVAGDSVDPEAIHFHYPEQTAFPPPSPELKYDMEAMVHHGGMLHLFSKNRTDPFDGYTRHHTLPDSPGTYAATLVDSFQTGGNSKLNYWIAGAALSPDGEHLVLISYPRAWIFSCFSGSDFFGGGVKELTYGFTQKEGAAWASPDTLYLTDELTNGILGGKLYRANLSTWTAEPQPDLGSDTTLAAASITLDPGAMTGASYMWNTGATSPTLSVNQSGTYAVTVVAPNGCAASDSVTVTLTPLGQAPPARMDLQLRAHYAPASGKVTVRYNLPLPGVPQLSMVDLKGRVVASVATPRDMPQPSGPGEQQFSFDGADGLYWVELRFGHQRAVAGLRVWRP